MNLKTIHEIKDNFVNELKQASDGQSTSLPFIKHTLTPASLVEQDDFFQTLVIGGSFYQKAKMKKLQNALQILEHDQGPQPVFYSKDDLLSFVDKHLLPDVTTIALNFAYPMTPLTRDGVLDGTLKSGSKENTFEGLIGEQVGKTIENYIKEKYNRTVRVSVANDTICLLLSGLLHHEWNNIAAGIVGTGLNFAIFIDEHTAVNLEAAYFDKFPQSEAGREIDNSSAAPGDALYEKEISGAYLYQHFNYLAKKQEVPIHTIDSTKQLDILVRSQNKDVADLARSILDHSASLVAAQIAGILEYSQRDLVFIMQGSFYWKGSYYKETVEKLVVELCPDYQASYENVLHSDLFGAAKLVG